MSYTMLDMLGESFAYRTSASPSAAGGSSRDFLAPGNSTLEGALLAPACLNFKPRCLSRACGRPVKRSGYPVPP